MKTLARRERLLTVPKSSAGTGHASLAESPGFTAVTLLFRPRVFGTGGFPAELPSD